MAELVHNVVMSFKAGCARFVRGFVVESRPVPELQSVDRYFANVGEHLLNARNRFEREYVENVRHADE